MSRVIQTAPISTVLPVTLEVAKQHLRETATVLDDEITRKVKQAAEYVENISKLLIVSRTIAYSFDAWPGNLQNYVIRVPDAPVLEVTGITYTDLNQSPQQVTVDTSVYSLDAGVRPNEIYLNPGKAWPAASAVKNSITVTYRAGLVDTDSASPATEASRANVPATLEAAVLMVLEDLMQFKGAKTLAATYENPAVVQLIHQNRCLLQ